MKDIPFTKSQRHSDECSFVAFLYRYKTENILYTHSNGLKKEIRWEAIIMKKKKTKKKKKKKKKRKKKKKNNNISEH